MKSPIDIIVKDPKDFVNLDQDRKISDKSWNDIIRLTQPPPPPVNRKDSSNNTLNIKKLGGCGGSNKKGVAYRMEIVQE